VAIAASVMVAGVGSTLALHWFTKPYVRSMWLLPHSNPVQLEFETFGLTARSVLHKANVIDLRPSLYYPIRSFRDGNTDQSFFVHVDIITENPQLKPLFQHVIEFPSVTDANASSSGAKAAGADPSQRAHSQS